MSDSRTIDKFILHSTEGNDNLVRSIEDLKSLTINKSIEIRILLGGLACSTKEIHYKPEDDFWEIYHYICDSFVVYTSTEQMLELTKLDRYIKTNRVIIEE